MAARAIGGSIGLLVAVAVMVAAPSAGWAAGAPVLAFSPTTAAGVYDFGAVSSPTSKTFTLKNSGVGATGALSVSLSVLTGSPSAFSKTADSCTVTSLGPGKSCAVTVTFSGLGAGAGARLTAISKKPAATASIELKASGDTIAPQTTITSGPQDLSGSSAAAFAFSATDAGGSGVAGYECKLDGASFGACTSTKTYTDLADGQHTFEVRAIDNAGNTEDTPAQWQWTIDATAPETTIASGPLDLSRSSAATFAFSATDAGSGVAGYECKLDGASFGACASQKDYSGLADGSHTFEVRAIDFAGNTDATPATYSWTIDTTAPQTTITSRPRDPSRSSTAAFAFSATDAGSGVAGYECRLDDASFGACTSAKTYTGLADGSHTFEVRAIDKAGNTEGTPATSSWTIETFTQIAAGYFHTCALTTAGAVKCWGRNSDGQLGDGSSSSSRVPVAVVGLTSGVAAITAGGYHTCALTTAGAVKCWGANTTGQLGDATLNSSSVPVAVDSLTSVAAISAGAFHTCALTAERAVKCWGYNYFGQLGDGSQFGDPTFVSSSVPVDVSGLTSVAAISAGGHHTCARTIAGGATCWGDNEWGELGDATTIDRRVPVDVSGLTSGVDAITAGAYHTCALTTGAVTCWGLNSAGELGDGSQDGDPSFVSSSVAVDVSGLTSVAAISAGGHHTCALTTVAAAKCWGANNDGQLGDGTYISRRVPVDVSGLTSVAATTGGFQHTCALTTAGAKCWGDNRDGQLGDGSQDGEATFDASRIPVDVR